MKKIKIMLMAVTVVSVVGGALAFKAKSPEGIWCITENPNDCPLTVDYTIEPNGSPANGVFCTELPPVSTTDCDVQGYQE